MIQGEVIDLQARVNVTFRLPDQPDLTLEFVIDTGFEGALTLPPQAVKHLGLSLHHEIVAKLADDSRKTTEVYRATILWDDVELSVAVLAMGSRPLLGTALLDGKRLCADFIVNGSVRVEACKYPGS